MNRIKITNLKPGACVINSLKVSIPGGGFIVRDAGVIGDPDLTELESLKIISITPLADPSSANPVQTVKAAPATQSNQAVPVIQKTQVQPVQVQPQQPVVASVQTGKPIKQGKQKKKNVGRPPKKSEAVVETNMTPTANVQKDNPVKQPEPKRPGTSFDVADPNDQMGAKVVVMGENGPEVRTMTYAFNQLPGPKYAGDTFEKGDQAAKPAKPNNLAENVPSNPEPEVAPSNEDGFTVI